MNHSIINSSLYWAGFTFLLVVISATVSFADRSPGSIAQIPPVVNDQGDTVLGSIASLEKVSLGGLDQWILIRGQSTDNPVLLFLHGGPGGAMMPWVDLIHTPALEAAFTVVHWDQRGAGKSYSENLTDEDLHPERFIDDTLQLSNLLRIRFGQDKIFLTGHSWGSALGFLTIQRDSSAYRAYIPTSERVAWNQSYTMGYEWAVAQAKNRGDAEVLKALQTVAPFDPQDPDDIAVQVAALAAFNAGDTAVPGLEDEMIAYAVDGQSPYYTQHDINNYIPGLELSSRAIETPEVTQGYDLRQSLPTVDIPVHFITGTMDRNTPLSLVEEYAAMLDAPDTSVTAIDGAAHMLMWDAPDAWVAALVDIKTRVLGQR